MRFVTAIALIGLSVSAAIAQSGTPDGRPISPEGIKDASGRPINPESISDTSGRGTKPVIVRCDNTPACAADDPFGSLRDPAGRPIRPDGINGQKEDEKRGS